MWMSGSWIDPILTYDLQALKIKIFKKKYLEYFMLIQCPFQKMEQDWLVALGLLAVLLWDRRTRANNMKGHELGSGGSL